MEVEIAAADGARRDRARALDDRVGGVNDEQDLPPPRELGHDAFELGPGDDRPRLPGQRRDDILQRHPVFHRQVLEYAVLILGKPGLESI